VEQSPNGSWLVKLAGNDAPISRHDTEEEAEERRSAYARGVARGSVGGPAPPRADEQAARRP